MHTTTLASRSMETYKLAGVGLEHPEMDVLATLVLVVVYICAYY